MIFISFEKHKILFNELISSFIGGLSFLMCFINSQQRDESVTLMLTAVRLPTPAA